MRTEENMQTKLDIAYKQAEYYYTHDYNCAQSVVMAVCDAFEIEIPDEILKVTSGLGGGVGFSGCICGALNGGAIAIGMFLGPAKASPATSSIARVNKQLADWFEESYATTCCRQLRRRRPFASREVKQMCTEITADTAKKVVTIISEA